MRAMPSEAVIWARCWERKAGPFTPPPLKSGSAEFEPGFRMLNQITELFRQGLDIARRH